MQSGPDSELLDVEENLVPGDPDKLNKCVGIIARVLTSLCPLPSFTQNSCD